MFQYILASCLALGLCQTQPDLLQLVWQFRDPILTQETLTKKIASVQNLLQVKSQIMATHEQDLHHSKSGGKSNFANAKSRNISVQLSEDSKYFSARLFNIYFSQIKVDLNTLNFISFFQIFAETILLVLCSHQINCAF